MKGQVQFALRGLNGEKLINELHREKIPLHAVDRRADRSLLIRCDQSDYAAIAALAENKGFQLDAPQPVGWFSRWNRMKKRWGLLLGAVIAMGLMIYALGFVWQVRIEKAGAYEGEVRAFLQDMGVLPGIRKSHVNIGDLREKLEWRLPRVSWVRTEWRGTALVIALEEGVPPPDIETAGSSGDVVADQDGLLVRLTTYAGTPVVKNGEFVRAGQTLIRGIERGKNGVNTPVKARGEALSRVWATERVRLPLWETASIPTGRQFVRRVMKTPFFAYSFQETPDFLTSDLQIDSLSVGGAWLPVTVQRETYQEVTLENTLRNEKEVMAEAEEAAMAQLQNRLKNQETVDKWINFRMIEGDTIVVEAAAELLVDVGRCQKNTGDTIAP